ncbi:MAG: phospholipid carrier-dependent glycosyltransferase [Thermoproteota archaeon]
MYRKALKIFREKTFITLLIIPLIFLTLRLSLTPVAWPEKPPMDCIYQDERGYEGCGFIFDEAHYIPAVRIMKTLNQPVNLEHPPLSKWIIMLGMSLFGDNPWGWRSLNIFFSTITLFLVGLLAFELSKNVKLSLIAQSLTFMDVTFFNISGFAILDPPALAFMMLTVYLYVKGYGLFSGISLGLAMLSKSSMILVAISLIMIEVTYPIVNRKTIEELINSFRRIVRTIIIPAMIVFLAGLGVYDMLSGAFPTPIHHLDFIFRYHSSLVFQDPTIVEMPLSWIIPPITRHPSAYYVVTVTPPGWHPQAFWGVSSPLWWSIWIIVPLAYVFLKDNRNVKNPCPEILLLGWIIATYGSFILLGYIYHRWMYLFYFLQISLIMASIAPILLEKNGYRLLLKVLMALQALWFIMWFPVKPDWLLDIMLNLGLGEVPWI